MTTIERRQAILETLCRRRHDTRENLAFEFGVSKRTIEYDVLALSSHYPIYTEQGKGGGVFIEKWFKFGMVYMTSEQVELLKRLNEGLSEKDQKIMQSILNTYARPIKSGGSN